MNDALQTAIVNALDVAALQGFAAGALSVLLLVAVFAYFKYGRFLFWRGNL